MFCIASFYQCLMSMIVHIVKIDTSYLLRQKLLLQYVLWDSFNLLQPTVLSKQGFVTYHIIESENMYYSTFFRCHVIACMSLSVLFSLLADSGICYFLYCQY
jgi:hypothetical protein